MPQGYFFMFSTLDYFLQQLTFQNINLLLPKDIGTVFYPAVQGLPFLERKCSAQLVVNVEQVHAPDDLCQEVANEMIDTWMQTTNRWKQVGLSSVFYDRMMNFVKKKSILIDDSVFLISTSGSDSEPSINDCPQQNN